MMVMVMMMMIDDDDDDDPYVISHWLTPPLLGNLTYAFLLVVPAANTTNGCDFNSSHGH